MLEILRYIFGFLVLVLVQVFILNNIQFSNYINPYLYILFILTLPTAVNRTLLMVLAFLLGISIDMFSNTLGIHAFACVLIAFLRDFIIGVYVNSKSQKEIAKPGIFSMGGSAFLKYVITMTLIHHLALFVVDTFSFGDVGFLLMRVLCSSVFTILLIVGVEFFKRTD